jgi:hypothetical protein
MTYSYFLYTFYIKIFRWYLYSKKNIYNFLKYLLYRVSYSNIIFYFILLIASIHILTLNRDSIENIIYFKFLKYIK